MDFTIGGVTSFSHQKVVPMEFAFFIIFFRWYLYYKSYGRKGNYTIYDLPGK